MKGERPSLNKLVNNTKAKSHIDQNEVRTKIGGIDPIELSPEDETRFETIEKLRRFYAKFTDNKVVKQGLGEVADFIQVHGEKEFNKLLKKKHGFDLNTLAEHESHEERLSNNKNLKPNGRRGSNGGATPRRFWPFRVGAKSMNKSSSASGASKHTENLRSQLQTFYEKHDKNVLSNHDKFDKIMDYALNKGVAALNIKLMKLYKSGLDLNLFDHNVDAETNDPGNFHKNSRGQSFFQLMDDAEKKSQKRITASVAARSAFPSYDASSRTQFPSPPTPAVAGRKVPRQLKEYLVLYYAIYDPEYVVYNRLNEPQKVVVNNGLNVLDTHLQTKYKEKFSEFQARAETLQGELITFYSTNDPSRVGEALMGILQWSLRNGRKYLNSKLRKKYHVDLDGTEEGKEEHEDMLY